MKKYRNGFKMTRKEALERIIDMAYDARNGLPRQLHQHDLDSDALEIMENYLDGGYVRDVE